MPFMPRYPLFRYFNDISNAVLSSCGMFFILSDTYSANFTASRTAGTNIRAVCLPSGNRNSLKGFGACFVGLCPKMKFIRSVLSSSYTPPRTISTNSRPLFFKLSSCRLCGTGILVSIIAGVMQRLYQKTALVKSGSMDDLGN